MELLDNIGMARLYHSKGLVSEEELRRAETLEQFRMEIEDALQDEDDLGQIHEKILKEMSDVNDLDGFYIRLNEMALQIEAILVPEEC